MWGTTEDLQTTDDGADVVAGRFYPDWENDSGTCLEDGNGLLYMAHGATVWLSDSLIERCLRFYQVFFILFVNIREVWHSLYFTRTIIILLFDQSDTNSCLNPNGSGLWYADHLNSNASEIAWRGMLE